MLSLTAQAQETPSRALAPGLLPDAPQSDAGPHASAPLKLLLLCLPTRPDDTEGMAASEPSEGSREDLDRVGGASRSTCFEEIPATPRASLPWEAIPASLPAFLPNRYSAHLCSAFCRNAFPHQHSCTEVLSVPVLMCPNASSQSAPDTQGHLPLDLPTSDIALRPDQPSGPSPAGKDSSPPCRRPLQSIQVHAGLQPGCLRLETRRWRVSGARAEGCRGKRVRSHSDSST